MKNVIDVLLCPGQNVAHGIYSTAVDAQHALCRMCGEVHLNHRDARHWKNESSLTIVQHASDIFSCMSCLQVQQMEVQTAEQLLSSMVVLLPQLTSVDEHDKRMQGKLELTLQLVRVLGTRSLASTDSHHLVHLLLSGRLAVGWA